MDEGLFLGLHLRDIQGWKSVLLLHSLVKCLLHHVDDRSYLQILNWRWFNISMSTVVD